MINDVVVVGAGPAGATVGGQIASAGFNVLIVEKECSPGKNKVCGGALSKRHFSEIKLPKELIEKEVNKLAFHFPDEKLGILKRYIYMILDREKLDQFLVQKAEKNGAELLISTRACDVNRSYDHMVVSVKRSPQEKIREIKARMIIFADGANTLANKKFGIGFQNRPDGTAMAATYDLKWKKNPIDSLEFFFSNDISPTGYGWVFPKKDSINIGVACLISKIQQNIKNSLNHLLALKKLYSLEVIKYGTRLIPQSIPKQIHSDAMLVVGDAAGTAEPLSGSGIANAVANGRIAAKVAIEALEINKLKADFLSRYKDLWNKTLNYQRIQIGNFLQRMALESGVNSGILLKRLGYFDRNKLGGRSFSS